MQNHFPGPNNIRKPNQDSFLMKHCLGSSALVIACFDGHGEFGQDVSSFCKHFIEMELPAHPSFMTNLRLAILDVTNKLGNTFQKLFTIICKINHFSYLILFRNSILILVFSFTLLHFISERHLLASPAVDSIFSGSTMILIVMQGQKHR